MVKLTNTNGLKKEGKTKSLTQLGEQNFQSIQYLTRIRKKTNRVNDRCHDSMTTLTTTLTFQKRFLSYY